MLRSLDRARAREVIDACVRFLAGQQRIQARAPVVMQDKNHLQIADLILQWIDTRVSKPRGQ